MNPPAGSPPPADPEPDEPPFAESLLGRGLSSDLAGRVAGSFPGWPALAAAGPGRMQELFTPGEIESLARARTRRAVPAATVRRLLTECDSRCCMCWNLDSDTGVVLHHLRAHAEVPDDRYENLVVLCPNHHAAVHTVHELDRHPYPPDVLRRRKADFAAAVAAFKAGTRPAPGREREDRLGRLAAAPLPAAHFTGRGALVSAAAAGLAGGSRRVALVGMGGVGKTALALKTIEAVRGGYPGGVCWFEAEIGRGLGTLLRCLLSSLGNEETGLDLDQQLALVQGLLAERIARTGALLLAIDNAGEGELGGLAKLVSGLPQNAALLVTTRETTVAAALGAAALKLDPLERAEARTLLRTVSCSVLAGGDDVDRLLALLGDLPLAVELVARQIAVREGKPGFSLASLCAQLEQFNATLLSFPGHRGIAVSFALSYDSLDRPVQSLFRSLGVFAEGPLWLHDITGVAALGAGVAEPLLDRLVAVSVLQWGPGRGDYRIHPLLHKYAGFILEQAGGDEQQAVGLRFRRHFISRTEAVAASEAPDLGAVDALFGNLAKAIRDSAAAGDHTTVCGIVDTLAADLDYFQRRNLELESVPLAELAVASAEKLREPDVLAAHISHLGNAWSRLGEIWKARACYERSAAIVRKSGNQTDLASNLQNLALSMLSEGADPARIEKVLRDALAAARQSENTDALFGILSTLGVLSRQLGRLQEAAGFHTDALQVARHNGNRRGEGNSLSNLGLVMQELDREAEGERLVAEALAISREIGDRRGEGNRTGHLGGFVLRRALNLGPGPERSRLIGEARGLMAEAVRLARETRDPEKIASWAMNLGHTHLLTGDAARAGELMAESLSIALANGYGHIEAQVRYNLGMLGMQTGRLREALVHLQTAQAIFSDIGSPMAERAAEAISYVEMLLSEKP